MKFYLILFTLIFGACRANKELFSISYISEKEYNKIIKDTQQIIKPFEIKKNDSSILVPLDKGGQKVFKDEIRGDEDENRIEHYYYGEYKNINFSIIGVGYWESSKVILLDNLTGQEYDIFWDVPEISPDKRKFASILSYGLEGYPVGLQIIQLDTTQYYKFEKLIEIDQRQWDPLELCWASSNTLYLKIQDLNYDTNQKPAIHYLKVELNNSK